MEYDSSNIKILSEEEQNQFDWVLAPKLAHEYCKPLPFIQRLLETGKLAGVSIDWIEDKYLKKLPDIPHNEEFVIISRELQREAYY